MRDSPAGSFKLADLGSWLQNIDWQTEFLGVVLAFACNRGGRITHSGYCDGHGFTSIGTAVAATFGCGERPAIMMELSAFYLPQFHAIPENDSWWGEGFTEWTNVSKARPLFRGHRQPIEPGDLGFYALLDPSIRQRQAELASAHGITSFCYWHYWFAGRRLLQRPLDEVIATGQPKFPFFVAWANESWTGIWHGAPRRVLVAQTYPGAADDRAHFATLLPAFRDPRYVCRDGRPVFVVLRPTQLHEPAACIGRWQDMARAAGLPGLYMVAYNTPSQVHASYAADGFDAAIYADLPIQRSWTTRLRDAARMMMPAFGPGRFPVARESAMPPPMLGDSCHPCVFPNWDNTPRSGRRGVVALGTSPAVFEQHLARALRYEMQREPRPDRRLVMIKSWNEWADGNFLEPDARYGRAWLEAVRKARQTAEIPAS